MSQKRNPEIEAMEIVLRTLEPLDEDSRGRVLQWITQKLSIKTIPDTRGRDKDNNPNKNHEHIKDFIAAKKPQDTYQRLACLAYYLENNEDKPEFKTKDLTDANTRARLSKISNMTVYVDHTTRRYGFLSPTNKGNKSLTQRGEAVVKALPDYESVKQALEENPFKTKARSKSKTKRKLKKS